MGSYYFRKQVPEEEIALGESLQSSSEELIEKTEKVLDMYKSNQMNEGHKRIRNSIQEDLKMLRKIADKGGEIKLGILGRSSNQENLIETLFIPDNYYNPYRTTFISSDKSNINILNDNNLNEETKNSLEELLSHNLGNNEKLFASIKLTKDFPTPDLINRNLIVTRSPLMKPLSNISSSSAGFDVELDMDDINKYLLYSLIHDMIVYIPEGNNLDNEISFLNALSDNMLILKLLRGNNFMVVLNQNRSYNQMTQNKLINLIVKLGKTVVHELNFENAENDKIKYLGCMIEKKGADFCKNASFKEVVFIKQKFDQILKNEDYKEYLNQMEKDQKPISYKQFKKNFVNSMSDLFITNSGIDKVEDHLLHSFLKIIDNKISIVRSSLSFKVFLYENFNEIENNSDFSNSIIFTRSEIVEEMNKSFANVRSIFKIEESHLIESCESLIVKMTGIKSLSSHSEEQNERSYLVPFFDLFNISGNFVQYNNLISESRRDYYTFNKNIFTVLTKVSNNLYRVFESLSKIITNKYANLFLELENRKNDIFLRRGGQNSDQPFDKFNNFPIEEIIKSKLDKINILSLHLISMFGFTTFSLNQVFPWYYLPSYGGTSMSTLLLVAASLSKNPTNSLKLGITGGVVFSLSMLLAFYLKDSYIKKSKINLVNSVDQVISFLSLKATKIMHFEHLLNDFIQIYSKETLELIDLLTGIE